MQIKSMCLSAHRRFPFGSADAAVRARARDIMDRAIDFSCELGIRVIQLAGYDVYYEPSTPESVRAFREGMLWAAGRARAQPGHAGDGDNVHAVYELHHQAHGLRGHDPLALVQGLPRPRATSAPGARTTPRRSSPAAWAASWRSILKDTIAVTDSCEGKFKCVPFGSG